MTIQHFHTAASAIVFPSLVVGNVEVRASQLRKILWHAPAQKLVGAFTTAASDWNILGIGNPAILAAWRLSFLWRDGTGLGLHATPLGGFISRTVRFTQTATGSVVAQDLGSGVATDEVSAATGDAMFPLSEVWANDVIPTAYASAGLLGAPYDASYFLDTSAAYIVAASNLGGFRVLAKPSGSIVFSATGTTWGQPRDLVYINGTRTAATFMQLSGNNVAPDKPALIRVFDTASSPWSLLWTDTLPASDSIIAWDPAHQILYSTSKWASNAYIHASKLKQSPASLSVITLVSGSTLQEMRAGQMSVYVTDGQNSAMSGVLVVWTLSASVSGGQLLSAYTRTNASGIALATYIGPLLSGTTTTEAVCAAVATIDPVGV